MSAIDYSNLDAVLGAYNRGDGYLLYQQEMLGFKSARYIDVYQDIKDEEPMVTPFIKEIVQVGKEEGWNPTTGALDYVSRILKVRQWQVDLTINPIKEHRKWTAKLMASGSDPYKYPFELFIMEQIYARIKDTMERIIWKGVYNSGTAAAANVVNPLEVCDGFLKIIADAITATTITPVATGAITKDNAVEKLQDMWKALPEELKYKGVDIFCSHNTASNYYLNYKENYGDHMTYNSFKQPVLEISEGNAGIQPLPGLEGSGRVVIAPKGILQIGMDLMSDTERIIVEKEKRNINLLVDGKIGVGISAFEIDGKDYLIVNDQA